VHQGTSARTPHLRENQRALRYNSPDCPVSHRTVHQTLSGVPAEQRLLRAQWLTATAFNALQCAQKSELARVAHRTVYRTCPVHHRTAQWPHKSELQRSNPNGLLTWLAHRTVRCAMRLHTSNGHLLVVGAINTPTTPQSMASKYPSFYTSTPYKSYSIQYKTHQRDQILSQLHTKL
jgi:hypothetical protein